MKKNNDTLKKALEEAARIEMANLPEEKQIIRPYSDKFEKEMNSLIGEEKNAVVRRRPRVKFAALIAAVIVTVLTVGTAAAGGVKVLSSEWRAQLQESAKKATYSEDIEGFDEAFAKADDYFANLTRETEGSSPLLLDYNDAYDIGITAEKDGYTFKIDKIVKGQRKHNKVINGSIFHGTAEFQWVVEDGYYLLAEVSRTDGKKLTAGDKEIWFDMSVVVAGYNPDRSQACLRGGYGISEVEEYGWYYAFEITEAMKFANHDLGLVVEEFPYEGDLMSYESTYIDENGLPAFRDHVEGTNLVVKFNIDEKFAEEETAQAYAKEYGWNIGLYHYKK